MKRKLSAKTVLLYVAYTALVVVSGATFEGAISFGLFVGALYSANPFISAIIYVAGAAVYGWTSVLHAGARAVVIIACWLAHRIAKRKIGKLNLLAYVVLANVFYCVYDFVDYFTLFDRFLYVACGIAFSYVSIYVFRAVFVRGLAYRPALDELICIALFIATCGYCLSKHVFWGLEIVYAIAVYALLFSATCFGAKTAFVCSALFGLGNILATGQYDCAVFLMIATLAVVMCNRVSRFLSAVSVVAVDVLFTYFLGLHGEAGFLALTLSFAAALTFSVIPNSVYNYVRDCSCGTGDRYLTAAVARRLSDNVSRRLYRLSDIFLSMKNAFYSMSSGKVTLEQAQIAIVKQCSEIVCRDCEQRSKCWRQELVNTEQSLLSLADCAVKKGKCTILDVPQTLSVKCSRVSAVLAEVNNEAQTYRQYVDRAEQADTSKTLLAEQMGGVSNLLMQVASDCKNKTAFSEEKETELVERLVFHNIMCVGANVIEQGDRLTVVITVSKHDVDNAVIEKVASGLTKQNMTVDRIEPTDSASWVNVYLIVKPRYDVVFGVSSVPKEGNEVSGDTHAVTSTDNGKRIVALCDGMGSGAAAEKMSATSIGLVENFYRAGFDTDVILSCVNRLLTSADNEVFCAVDIAVVDAYNGLVDFIKLGASIGLVKTGDKVEIVSGSSLPLGVLDEMTPSITQKAMSRGDCLALMSDGVVDCFPSPNELASVFESVSLNVPQSIAEAILSRALKNVKNKAPDDMTVVVAKLA